MESTRNEVGETSHGKEESRINLMDALDPKKLTPFASATVAAGDDELLFSNDDDLQGTDAESIVGVSIGKEQSRLLWPSTPAVEKSAAVDRMNEWGFFDGAEEDVQQEVLLNTLRNSDVSDHDLLTRRDGVQSLEPHIGRNQIKDEDSHKSGTREDGTSRTRTSMVSIFGDTAVKRFLSNLSFNPLTESSKPSQHASSSQPNTANDHVDQPSRRDRSNSLFLSKIPWGNVSPRGYLNTITSTTSPFSPRHVEPSSRLETRRVPIQGHASKVPSLRRSASDDSLI